MYKIKLVVDSHERWVSTLHYEYFCPVEVDKQLYRQFLQKNFPYKAGDADKVKAKGHNVPTIRPSLLDEKLEAECKRQLESSFFSPPELFSNSLGEFGDEIYETAYYNSLALARHKAGLDYGIAPNFSYNYDNYLRPLDNPTAKLNMNKIGGVFNMQLQSTGDDDFLYEWLLQGNTKQGKLVFYDGDLDQAFKIEFWDCYCVGVGEQMTAIGSTAMMMNLRLSPGITRNRSAEHEKVWKVTDITPSSNAFGPGPVAQDEPVVSGEANLIESYYTNFKGERIEVLREDEVHFHLISENCIGEKIDIDFANDMYNFKYNNEILENDMLLDFEISDNHETIILEVVRQTE
ncbi:type VI secretion system tube protein TssD [Saccharicrinis aurantiacus]|uniref:type VI secretion system tube protein TssD n=1 Tax=Saccharicrinis aurantiacus TaxID=1849719 RepID=UPI00094F4C85|nr:type VI secretion system tube protein TssD [Saccharicrinis aurantiacus]